MPLPPFCTVHVPPGLDLVLVRDPATAVIEYTGYEYYQYRLTGGAVH